MSFVSAAFLLFLPTVFFFHYIGRGRRWQNGVLLAASFVFYGWWDYRFCGLLLGTALLDFWAGARIAASTQPRAKRLFLGISLAGNLGALGFFKYFNFFADSLSILLAAVGLDINTSTLAIILPVGISFYTFQSLSYAVDIYRGKFKPSRDWIEYLTFVSFFPQLVAGPIERATELLPQIKKARVFSHQAAVAGCQLILWGLCKKMLVADNLAVIADAAFAHPAAASPAQLLAGTVCFAFQIYGDFSGYSDIAAGVGALFGIQLRRNFAYPYFSQSLTEFWRRWHISLSTWFRDYVFIPLGGSRGPVRQTAINMGVTMALSGLWHGAAGHFLAWGVFHGFALVAGRLVQSTRREIPAIPAGPGLVPAAGTLWRMARTFGIVCAGWVLFRADTVAEAAGICGRIVLGLASPNFYRDLLGLAQEQSLVSAILLVFVTVEWLGRASWNPLPLAKWPIGFRWVAYSTLLWCVLLFGTRHVAGFIYFQF